MDQFEGCVGVDDAKSGWLTVWWQSAALGYCETGQSRLLSYSRGTLLRPQARIGGYLNRTFESQLVEYLVDNYFAGDRNSFAVGT
jgi:hypothetical protein